jgi:hypothetical protein
VLPPAEDSCQPYRVEVALPAWVLDGDPALRSWLFPYGGAIRLEGPQGLVEEPRRTGFLRDYVRQYEEQAGPRGVIAMARKSSPPAQEPSQPPRPWRRPRRQRKHRPRPPMLERKGDAG